VDRRQYLGLTGASITALLGGCSTGSDSTRRTGTATVTPEETATPEPTEQPTETAAEQPNYPDTGSLSFNPAGGAPADHTVFNGEVDLGVFAGNPGDYEMPSMQELREKYHFQQSDRIAEARYEGENQELLMEFPRNLLDPEWVQENIYKPLEERWGQEMDDWFHEEEYNSDAPLDERIRKSNYLGLWTEIERRIEGQISLTHDFIRTAAIAATEYHSTGNETFTSHMKTQKGSHGLGIALTNLTYNEGETSEQNVWGIETDGSEEKQIWPLQEGYINRSSQIPIEKPEDPGNILQWMRAGFTNTEVYHLYEEEDANIDLEVEGVDQWVHFKRNPENHAGMKFVDSMVLAAYIEDEAYEDGNLPELEGATVRVTPEGLDYSLAS
jgi:hypothetical protein